MKTLLLRSLLSFAYLVHPLVLFLHWLFRIRVAYAHLALTLSLFTLGCGLLASIGKEPHTNQLLFVGVAGTVIALSPWVIRLSAILWQINSPVTKKAS